MICLHPGNLLAPWKMPQRISSAVTACGGSVCESPPQQAPTGPLIPRVANSFWLAISQPSLSAAIAAGAEAVLQLERVCVRVWPFVCPWLEGITEYVSGRYSQRYTKKAMLWLIKGGRGYCVDLLLFSFSFFFSVTQFIQIRLHINRQGNNMNSVVAHKVRTCKIALTEPEGKTVILRSPSSTHPSSISGLSACGELYYPDLLPVMMNPQPWEDWPARPPFAGD